MNLTRGAAARCLPTSVSSCRNVREPREASLQNRMVGGSLSRFEANVNMGRRSRCAAGWAGATCTIVCNSTKPSAPHHTSSVQSYKSVKEVHTHSS
jgi:hypothetical protein